MRAQYTYTPADKARFWKKVNRTGDGCWEWTAGRYRNGYGQFGVGSEVDQIKLYAHRVAYELLVGPIPEGMLVCHNCPGGDTRHCVNPAHLWLGSYADNNRDCQRKEHARRGERAGGAKLTEGQVRAIRTRRATGETGVALAAEYGVSTALISLVSHGQRWSHI
jgi:hypothetical protein